MARPSWGHVSRHCVRCGDVGPRVHNPSGMGWIHAYCRTEEEKRAERQRLAEQTKRQQELSRPRGVPGTSEFWKDRNADGTERPADYPGVPGTSEGQAG